MVAANSYGASGEPELSDNFPAEAPTMPTMATIKSTENKGIEPAVEFTTGSFSLEVFDPTSLRAVVSVLPKNGSGEIQSQSQTQEYRIKKFRTGKAFQDAQVTNAANMEQKQSACVAPVQIKVWQDILSKIVSARFPTR